VTVRLWLPAAQAWAVLVVAFWASDGYWRGALVSATAIVGFCLLAVTEGRTTVSRRGVPVLYEWTTDVPAHDPDGQVLTYRSGQPMAARTTVTLSARHITPITDDLVLRIGVGADSAGQSALLTRLDVQPLLSALACLYSTYCSTPGADHSRLELEWVPDPDNPVLPPDAVLTVVGYGHDWKRRSIPLPGPERDRLRSALGSWLRTGWAGVAKTGG
jgi:hypothetical protein